MILFCPNEAKTLYPKYGAEFKALDVYSEESVVWRAKEQEAQVMAAKRAPAAWAGKYRLAQDEDVCNTWFKSGMFPFSRMGCPEQTVAMWSAER